MTGVLYRLARFSVRHRFAVLAAWILLAVALVGVSHRLGDNTNDNVTLPGSNSQQAADTLSKSFPDQANGSSPIVLHVASVGATVDTVNAWLKIWMIDSVQASPKIAVTIGSSMATTVPNVNVRITIAAMMPISSLVSVAGLDTF